MQRLRQYKRRLYHVTPGWVCDDATFHIRIRCDGAASAAVPEYLIRPHIGTALLESVRLYHQLTRWYCHLFLLMPDHLHALLAFPRQGSMSRVVKDWKSFHTRTSDVQWQDDFFDHRIRNDREFERKAWYIRQNPVVKGLCAAPEDWPWVIDASQL